MGRFTPVPPVDSPVNVRYRSIERKVNNDRKIGRDHARYLRRHPVGGAVHLQEGFNLSSNKQAYDGAYQRTLQGKSARSPWGVVLSLFEDEYTRLSRLKGEREGMAARVAADPSPVNTLPSP
jgi:hypothetical protein